MGACLGFLQLWSQDTSNAKEKTDFLMYTLIAHAKEEFQLRQKENKQ